MNEMPLVSIIIPVYNGTNYMRCAIDSALKQTYSNCEVIVVNDGSTDGGKTEEVALSYGDRIRYFYKKNGGVATAVNFGIENMKGDYFAWLSHDDEFYPNKIELQMKAIRESGDPYAICHGNYDSLNMESGIKSSVNWLSLYSIEQLQMGCFAPVFLAIHGSTVLFHKSHFDRVGKYRTDLLATQDSEFLFRVMRGQKSVFVDEPLIIGRLHPEQGQRTMSNHKPEYNKMFVDFCEELSDEEKVELCGSVTNFYYRLYRLLRNSKPADEILDYLKAEIKARYKIEEVERFGAEAFKEMLNRNIPMNSSIFLFGAGYYGRMLSDELKDYCVTPRAFIDNSPEKQGTLVNGIECISLNDLNMSLDSVIVIISVSKDICDIRKQLSEYGVKNILTYQKVNQYLFRKLPQMIKLED